MIWVYTQESKKSITPEQMAKTYVYLADSERVARLTVQYFDEKNLEVLPGKYTRDWAQIESVMKLTRKYIPEISEV